jgi:putative addiction module component (TIGR02574 family)
LPEESRVTETALQVLRDALGLSPIERVEVIDGLLHSFDPTPDQRQVDAWKEEAESRIDAFEAGTLTDDTVQAMFDRINRQ